MSYKIEFRNLEESKKELEGFLEKVNYSTPFHTYEWLSALQKNLNLNCKIAFFYNGADLVGICPFFPKKVSLFNIHFSPVFATETAYLGILSKENIADLLKGLKKEIKDFFIIQSPQMPVEGSEFSIEKKETIITNLDSENAEEHFKRIRKGHRYDTRKAEKSGVSIKEDYSNNSINDYYEMLLKTYEKSEYKPLPRQFYFDIIKNLHEKNKIRFLQAIYNGKPIAAAAFPVQNKTVYYWTGASLKEQEYASLYPNNLIQWELIKWAYSENLETYDMLGANIEGIKKFKLGWGGQLAPYQTIYSSKKLKLMADLYAKMGTGLKEKIRKKVR